MSGDRYNVVFTGAVSADTSVDAVRQHLQTLFKLSPERADHLLSGRRIIVKRGVDEATARRFQQAFQAAGAEARIEPETASDQPAEQPPEQPPDQPPPPPGLALAPLRARLDDDGADWQGEDTSAPAPTATWDTSTLRLVEGHDWTLQDCQPPPPSPPDIDISGLALEPLPEPTPQATPEKSAEPEAASSAATAAEPSARPRTP
ncbi:hypothetical protein F2Q65_15130 [Thiohalocapsa marina]|uniref:Uncharacterized protein n=1 Tax=Thiohalocapsa marina TaxID=424902 RepID=A0A5M8FMH1_9GAMM|nr:hypothetical protein [Thiohalocapsa marina]KAA6183655.1 hypothetical protein F2Q65_15130 [Thiohalocapsa marina]